MTPRRAALVVALFAAAVIYDVVAPRLAADDAEVAAYTRALAAAPDALGRASVVVVHPPWRDDVVDALVAARAVPAHARATTAFAPKHGDPLPPLLVVADRRHPLPRALRAGTRVIHADDEIELRAVDGARATTGFVLEDALFRATVEIEKEDGARVACRYDAARAAHVCPGLPSWNRVGREQVTTGGQSASCIWAHPISRGTVRVALPDVVARGPLRFAHALADSALRSPDGRDVTARVLVDGREAGRFVRTNTAGFTGGPVPFPDDGAAHALTVEVTTEHDGARHYCFTLDDGGRP